MHAGGRNKNTNELLNYVPEKLKFFFSENPEITLAFSGGLDSRFLAHVASICGCVLELVHIRGPHVSQAESGRALAWAKSHGLELKILELDPLAIAEVARGDASRCYFCKKALFGRISDSRKDRGRILCDGTNYDDLSAFRPGMKAVQELGIKSPLALAGLSKEKIRLLAESMKLENPGQKARPCLLTRYAYNVRPDRRKLVALAAAEEEIENLLLKNNLSHVDFRLRLMPEPVLHMREVQSPLLEQIHEITHKYGFGLCKFEFMERVSGFFDRK